MNRIMCYGCRVGIIIFCLLCFSGALFAVPALSHVFSVEQPDGTMLNVILRGDEFYDWIETEDGYAVVRDVDGVYKYATVHNNKLCASSYIARNVNNRTPDEVAYLIQSKSHLRECIQQQCQRKAVAPSSISDETDTLSMRKISVPKNGTMGKRVILTVLMGFPDLPFTKTAVDFHNLMNQEGYNGGGNAGSVHDFYHEDSYGKLNVSSIVVGPYTAKHNSDYYQWNKNGSTIRVRELVRDAVHWASDRVNFNDLDGDGDGYVDCVNLVIAGYNKAECIVDKSIIWPHQSELASAIIRDGKKAKKYIVTVELQLNDEIASIGTICHELGHVFGAPDYYDVVNSDDGYSGTGVWDVMAHGVWNNTGRCPAHNNPYTKCYLYKWATASVLSPTLMNSYRTIPSSHSIPAFVRVNTSVPNEFFLFEYRRANGFDKYIPSEGLLIYHAHADLSTNISSNSINTTHPQKLYIVNASATSEPNADHSSYGSSGNSGKWVYPGNGYNKNIFFTANSVPAAVDWFGNPTGVDICYIRPSNATLTFMVNPQIQGPNAVCDEDVFSLSHVPAGAKVTWSYKRHSIGELFPPVLFPEGNEGNIVLIKRGYKYRNVIDDIRPPIVDSVVMLPLKSVGTLIEEPYVGIVELQATIECGKNSYTISKEIAFPTMTRPIVDDITGGGIGAWKVGETKTLTVINCKDTDDDNFQWVLKRMLSIQPDVVADDSTIYMGRIVDIKPITRGFLYLHVTNLAGCAPQNDTTYVFIVGNQRAKMTMEHPNPVSGNTLKIEIVEEDYAQEPMFLQRSSLSDYRLELWHNQFGCMRQMQTTDKEPIMDISNLQAGWYELVLLLDGDIATVSRVLIER